MRTCLRAFLSRGSAAPTCEIMPAASAVTSTAAKVTDLLWLIMGIKVHLQGFGFLREGCRSGEVGLPSSEPPARSPDQTRDPRPPFKIPQDRAVPGAAGIRTSESALG